MDKITKNLERALAALQLANNEIERQQIMKRVIVGTNARCQLLAEIRGHTSRLENVLDK